MEGAISMFLAEEITATDERLNYLSHEELGLICPHPKCRELVFHKPCIEGGSDKYVVIKYSLAQNIVVMMDKIPNSTNMVF